MQMKQKYKLSTHHDIRSAFERDLPHIVALASSSLAETEFKQQLNELLLSEDVNPNAVRNIARLIANDGKTIFELSTESEIELKTISLLWQFLTGRLHDDHEVSVDFLTDLYHQFMRLYTPERSAPSSAQVLQWMKRWPSGLNEDVRAIRRENKERIIAQLIRRIERRHAALNRYVFPEGCSDEAKRLLVGTWWNDHRFHLTFAVKSADELNRMLGHTLSEETMQTYRKAREKGIPVFVTPYYLSLLNPTGRGYDDQTLSTYDGFAPELTQFILEYGYGDIFSRENLDRKYRQIATIAALTALGNARPQLKFHIEAGLNVGLSEESIKEIMLLMTVYSGFPSAINGMNTLREVLDEGK